MDKEKHSDKKKQKKKNSGFAYWWKWPLTVLVIAFCLSLSFGLLSEVALSGAGIAISIVVIIIFIAIAIITDMVGVAVTAASLEPFRAMAAKKVRGAKEAIKLIENADRVSSVFADVIGDICGILSGAAGATVAIVFISTQTSSFVEIFIASLVSAIIASLTIFGKAFCKKYALHHSEKIILILGKCISIFHPQKKPKEHKKAKKENKINVEENTLTTPIEKNKSENTNFESNIDKSNEL